MRLHLVRLVWLANKIKMASDQICIRFMAKLCQDNTGWISTVSLGYVMLVRLGKVRRGQDLGAISPKSDREKSSFRTPWEFRPWRSKRPLAVQIGERGRLACLALASDPTLARLAVLRSASQPARFQRRARHAGRSGSRTHYCKQIDDLSSHRHTNRLAF